MSCTVIHCGCEHEQPGKSDFGNSHVLNVFCNIIKTNVCSKFSLALGLTLWCSWNVVNSPVGVWNTGSAQAAASDIHRPMPTHMADIRRDWLTNQNTD